MEDLINPDTSKLSDEISTEYGTTSTGNVARRAFSDNSDYLKCVLSAIAIPHKPASTKIHTQLSAILRVLNSGMKVNTLELGKLCQDTYLCVLNSFPWASITPTLHKLLAHSEELIRESK